MVLVVDPAVRSKIDPALVAEALEPTHSQSQVAVMLAEERSVGEVASATDRQASTAPIPETDVRARIRAQESDGQSRPGTAGAVAFQPAGHR